MSPWLFLGWAVAVAVSIIVVAVAIAVVIAVARQVRDPKARRLRKRVGAN
jgi:mannose/fructose/N-acetylgalactosamine-specific phosphotransferase system component IIC